MSLGYDRPLYLLPFDYRHSYVIGMFKFKPSLTTDEHDAVVDSKQVIYDGFRQAIDREWAAMFSRHFHSIRARCDATGRASA